MRSTRMIFMELRERLDILEATRSRLGVMGQNSCPVSPAYILVGSTSTFLELSNSLGEYPF